MAPDSICPYRNSLFGIQYSRQLERECPWSLAESRIPVKTASSSPSGPVSVPFALLIGGKNDKLCKMRLVFGNGYVTERNKSLQFKDGEVVDRAALDSVGIGLFF